jgi:hypothetical protein
VARCAYVFLESKGPQDSRPLYRVRMAQDGTWAVDWCPWLALTATDRREAVASARAAVATWLDVDGSDVDVVIG